MEKLYVYHFSIIHNLFSYINFAISIHKLFYRTKAKRKKPNRQGESQTGNRNSSNDNKM